MKPINVRLQNGYSGTGVEKDPVICWKYGLCEGGHVQAACQIQIYQEKECVYDSGIVNTDRQNQHICSFMLESHKIYKVIVKIKDEAGSWAESEPYSFLSGIVQETDWKASWISNGTDCPHYLGKTVILEKKIKYAAISAAGVGQYQMKINGRQPDDSVLNGSWTDYRKHIHYQTYDISSLLREKNEILIEVGNGWYCNKKEDSRHFYTKNMGYEPFSTCLAAIALMTVVYEDGEEIHFGTGADWWYSVSETTYTNIYGSEDYDARKEGRKEKAYCITLGEDKAPCGKLIPMLYPPVRVKKVYQGIFLKELQDGSRLYDLGQNMSGLFEIAVSGKRGTKVTIFPVEKLDILGRPWKTVDSWCCYTLKGEGVEKWKPKFTYGAGRYVSVAVDSQSKEQDFPKIYGITGYFITSSARDISTFYCSDYRYMQIHDLVLRAIESNLNHVHTDCPTIEKLGWQEANHLMAPSIFYTKEAETLWEKISVDQRDSQYEEAKYDTDAGAFPHKYGPGLLPSIAPVYGRFLFDGGEGSFWDIVPWGSSILLGAYEQYCFTGNKEILQSNYETAKKYVVYLYHKYLEYPNIYNKPAHLHFLSHGLGDWGIRQNRGESRENIETAYLYRDLMILVETAGWLDIKKDQEYYKRIAEEILDAYNRELLIWNPLTGEWAYDSYDKTGIAPTQATQAIPLQFGMVPEDKEESVKRSFLFTCKEKKLETGEIGLPYILRTLGELGQVDLVQSMIFQKYHPSYYRFIDMGETTLPEFWRDDSRSRNHDMMGAILEWLYRYLAGISSEDGYRNIKIAPILPHGIDCIKCIYEAVTGTIEVNVFREETLRMEVCIPPNTTGEIWMGKERLEIQGGKVYKLSGKGEMNL